MAASLSQHTTMADCIAACRQCHETCLHTAMTHCLQTGGKHVEPGHFRLMINCAELCQTSANFMSSESALHGAVCAACAEVCNACADSCEQIGDMDECVRVCRACARHCESMSMEGGRARPAIPAGPSAQVEMGLRN